MKGEPVRDSAREIRELHRGVEWKRLLSIGPRLALRHHRRSALRKLEEMTESGPSMTTRIDRDGAPTVNRLAESIIYVCALIADRPRAIDRYFDYFGERRPGARKAPANTPSSPVASGPAVSNR